MITGAEAPDSGELRIGDSVKLGYVDQSTGLSRRIIARFGKKSLKGEAEVNLGTAQGAKAAPTSARLTFGAPDQQKKVGQLSGGERNRVHLAKMLKSGANVILLDEPTNDLDVDTLRALEEALLDFAGCAVVISHDRWFLDRIATHIMAFEGDSHVEWFEGNYEDYEELTASVASAMPLRRSQPHRIKYRPLTRKRIEFPVFIGLLCRFFCGGRPEDRLSCRRSD